MLFNPEEWKELYRPDPGKNHVVIRHLVPPNEKRFIKTLRSNSIQQRTNEMISELMAATIFSKLGMGVLDAYAVRWLVTGRNKPVIVMRFVEDCRWMNFENPTLKDQIIDKEKFATILFLGDVLVNNTNRGKNTLAHIGWERRDDGKISLLPLDNGHTLGYSNEGTLDNENDLNASLADRYNNHFSSVLLSAAPNMDLARETLSLIDGINFEDIVAEVSGLITNTLIPADEEEAIISARLERVKVMLNRRKPLVLEKIKQWLVITQPEPPPASSAV